MNKGAKLRGTGFRSALLGATVLVSMGATAYAQDAKPATGGDVTEVVVTGFKRSVADAVRAKRNNIEISDGISSDGLGRFPDLNVGEALQRIPGIQINRESEGRNANIGLRGMPGYYARTTLNGQAFADPPYLQTTGGADGTPMGAFNSDIFSAFSVQKSPMANSQSGGLSGNIDMQIAPALSRKDGGFVKGSYERNSLGGLGAPSATFGYNKHINSDFAVFGVLAIRKENFRRDTLRFNGYSRLGLLNSGLTKQQFADKYGAYYSSSATTCSTDQTCGLSAVLGTSGYTAPSNVGSLSQGGVWSLGLMRQYTRMNVGTLITGSGGAEWRVNENLKMGVVGYYSERDLPDTVQYWQLNEPYMLSATATSSSTPYSIVTGLSTPVVMSNGYAVMEKTQVTNFDAKASTRMFSQRQAAEGIVANADWTNEKWKLSTVLTLTKSSNRSLETEADLRTIGNTAAGGANTLTRTLTTGFGDLDGYSQVVSPQPQNAIFAMPFYDATSTAYQAGYWNWRPSAPTDLFSADSRYILHVAGTHRYADKTVESLQFDVDRSLDFGPLSNIAAGVRKEKNTYKMSGVRNMVYGIQSQNVTSSMLIKSPSADDFMEGNASINSNWYVIDPKPFLSAITPVTRYANGGLSELGFNIFYADGGFSGSNFEITNELLEAYVQAKFDTEVLGRRLRGNIGVRSETTDYTAQTLDRTARVTSNGGVGALADYTWNTYKSSYDHLLPSAIAVYDVRDDMVVRAAYYKTYVRPDPRTSSPVQTYSYSTNSLSTSTNIITDVTVSFAGNRLKPYTADSWDLSWEWYNRPNGLISIAYFRKKLSNRIANIADLSILCPADGGGWGYGPLSWDGTYCNATGATTTTNGVTTSYHVIGSGQYNISSPTYVSGLELNIQQNFDFLPGFWKNFGGSLNYAFTQAKQRGTGAAAVPFPGISKFNYNAILYYETPKFGVRAVYNWRSEYNLDGQGTYYGAARNAAARGQLDMSASYNVSDRITVSLDAYNLTNSYRKEYQGDERMIRQIDYDGRTITATVRATF